MDFNFSFFGFGNTLATLEKQFPFFSVTNGARASIPVAQKESRKNNAVLVDDESEWIRRSDRKRRKVYETLNVKMLTDHRYLTGFENSKSPKKIAERKQYLPGDESDSHTEGDEVFTLFILKLAPFCCFWRHSHTTQREIFFINDFCLLVNPLLTIKAVLKRAF